MECVIKNKKEKSNEKIKDNSVCHGTDAVTDSAGTGKGRTTKHNNKTIRGALLGAVFIAFYT